MRETGDSSMGATEGLLEGDGWPLLAPQMGQRERPASNSAAKKRVKRSAAAIEKLIERSQRRGSAFREGIFLRKVALYQVAVITNGDPSTPVWIPLREWRPTNKDAKVFAWLDMNRNDQDFTNAEWTQPEKQLLPQHAQRRWRRAGT
jgi:hypothetical protein